MQFSWYDICTITLNVNRLLNITLWPRHGNLLLFCQQFITQHVGVAKLTLMMMDAAAKIAAHIYLHASIYACHFTHSIISASHAGAQLALSPRLQVPHSFRKDKQFKTENRRESLSIPLVK